MALLAQGWAASSRRAASVAPNTYNQHLASLSNFYQYAIKHEVLTNNPITRMVRKQYAARPIPGASVKKDLAAIDQEERSWRANVTRRS